MGILKLKTNPKKLLYGYTSYANTNNLREKNKTKIGDSVIGPGRPGKLWKNFERFAFYEVVN
jgi:hypothetical protein